MAELIGLVASCLQIADAAIQSGFALYKLINNYRKMPKRLGEFQSEVKKAINVLKLVRAMCTDISNQNQGYHADVLKTLKETLISFSEDLNLFNKQIRARHSQSKRMRILAALRDVDRTNTVHMRASVSRHYSCLQILSSQVLM